MKRRIKTRGRPAKWAQYSIRLKCSTKTLLQQLARSTGYKQGTIIEKALIQYAGLDEDV